MHKKLQILLWYQTCELDETTSYKIIKVNETK